MSFDSYENVYADISCGEGELAYESLEYISRYWQLYRELIQVYKTRFLFATDMVITEKPRKDGNYVTKVVGGYRRFLEDETYTSILIDSCLEDMTIEKTEKNSVFNGLQLDEDTLQHIYEINPRRFLGVDNDS